MARKTVTAADLFCGAGGSSTGLRQACEALGIKLHLIAVNHWNIAIDTHTANHPEAEHLCANLDNVDPRKLVPSGKLDILIASPECTHHSNARGGKPMRDQSRASAWRIVEWCSQIQVEHVLIENVKEFQSWGPLGTNGRPLKRQKGATYMAFLNALRSLGYNVEAKVLNAADHGDPTSRERLFIQARRGRKAITWPEATHGPKPSKPTTGRLFAPRKVKPYRPARDIIDWSIQGESIFNRKRPLAPATMQRIEKGLQKFCGLPFVVPQQGNGSVRSIEKPLQTITTTSRGVGLVEPFIIAMEHGGHVRSIDKPLNTITTARGGAHALVQPFLVKFYGGQFAHSVDEPLPAITANYEHYGLCQPFIVELRNSQNARSLDDPLSTICTTGAHHALCQPFLIRYHGNHNGRNDGANRVSDLDEPLPNLDTSNRYGLVQPFIVPTNHGKNDTRSHSIEDPMPTVTSVDAWGLIEPFLVKYNGTGGAMSVDDPLDSLTSKDRFGLVDGNVKQDGCVFLLDIRFRMLQPHELAAAMSFPKSYVFAGNREQKVKQIGNAVPVGLSTALCRSILSA